MTKSQVNKLGERLRAPGPPDDEDLALLQRFRERYSGPLRAAQESVRDHLHVETSARLKTINTIVEKLRRERTRLAEMQDIAGLRIVSEMTLARQDEMVSSILLVYPGARVVDRRQEPSYGYRAVHVIPTVDGYPVEIQVRTKLQDLWAQAMEKLADEAGREIRYGAVPEARADEVEELRQISLAMAELETLHVELHQSAVTIPPPRRASSGQREALLARLHLRRLRAKAAAISQRIRDRLGVLLGGQR